MLRFPRLMLFLAFGLLCPACVPALPATAPQIFRPLPPASPPPSAIFTPTTVIIPPLFSGTVGPQGIQGIQGPQGPAGPAGTNGVIGHDGAPGANGLPGVDASGLIGINVKAGSYGLTPAVGDGVTDDTAALQAAIQYGQDHGLPVLIPPGVYKITAPLTLCNPPSPDFHFPLGSIVLRGLSTHAAQGYSVQGVTIQMQASGKDSVLKILTGKGVHLLIADITLDGGATAQGTQNGILVAGTWFSGLRTDNVNIPTSSLSGVDTALNIAAQTTGSGANGEFLNCLNCFFSGRSTCVKINNSQSYSHRFYGCSGGTLNGGTAFDIGDGGGGCQVDVYGWSGTFVPPGSGTVLPNTFVLTRGAGMVSFYGGRMEHTDTLIKAVGGTYSYTGKVNIENMQFTDGGRAALVNITGDTQQALTVENCDIYGTDAGYGPLTITDNSGNGSDARKAAIRFLGDDFFGWTTTTSVTTAAGSVLTNCRLDTGDGQGLRPFTHS